MRFHALIIALLSLCAFPASATPTADNEATEAALTGMAKEHYQRALTLYQERKYTEVIKELKKAHLIKRLPTLLISVALAYEKLGDHDNAIYYYKKYLADAPEDRGGDRWGEVQAEIAYLEKRVAEDQKQCQNPDPGPVYYWGDYEGGIQLYKHCWENTRREIFLYHIGESYRLAGKYQEALAYFEEYQQKTQDQTARALADQRIADIKRNLALQAKGQIAKTALSMPERLIQAAEVDLGVGNYTLASGEFKAAYDVGKKTDHGLLKRAADAWERAGNKARAIQVYRAYLATTPPPADRASIEERIGWLENPTKVPPPQNQDSDGDGVPDAEDKCRGWAAGANPDPSPKRHGCPRLDQDHDGIFGNEDQCPNDPETVNGVEDDDGCPEQGPPPLAELVGNEVVMRAYVHFNQDNTIQTSSFPLLEQVARITRGWPERKLRIEAHTDKHGTAARQEAISEARAENVGDWILGWLREHGAPRARAETVGYGGTKPIVPNITPRNRAQNRRVCIFLTP